VSDAATHNTETQAPAPSPVAETAAPASPQLPNGDAGYRVPQAVRRQARRAHELQDQLQAEQQAADATKEAAQAQQQAELDGIVPIGSPQEQQQQDRQAPPPAPPQDDWQHRYRTLQGKYDSEIPHLRSQVQQLENLIASMQSAPPPPAPAPPAAEVEIPEDDYTTYGPEFVDSTRRWARAEVQRDLQAQQQQIAELRAHQERQSENHVKDRVRAELDRDPELAGRWLSLDTDAGFNSWLQELDPFSGARRLDMLRAAYASGDSLRTGRFFKAYLQEHTDYGQPVPGYSPQTPIPNGSYTNGNGAGRVDLASFAAPGRASNATPGPGAPERRIWTNRDIQAFYDGRIRGRYRGREAEADRIERDILAAAAEGRIANA